MVQLYQALVWRIAFMMKGAAERRA